MGLPLCEAAIHKRFRSSDVAAVFGREEHDGPGDLFGCPEPAERTMPGIIFLRCSPTSEDASRPVAAGVLIEPGLIAFTRMRRSLRSVVQVRANERTAAFVAL